MVSVNHSLIENRERAAVLALMAQRQIPWNRLAGSIEEHGSALALLAALDRKQPARLFEADEVTPSLDELEQHIDVWAAQGIKLITVLDYAYPANLRMVHDRPPALFVRGELDLGDERSVAVVGTRQATSRGIDQAQSIAEQLVAADYVVASGLALGIDTAVHTAALKQGGRTIAVVGTGLNHAYPRQNAGLQERLGQVSAVISQFLPDQGPRPWTFPQRNAVMSGLARATVVVEAGHTSGARMQARLALEHGRPVFLLSSLLTHAWARTYADERPGTYVVEEGSEVVHHVERLYADEFALAP